MRISSKARYGVRAMARLYTEYDNEPVSLKAIAKIEMIDEAYLAQLLLKFKNAALITTARGKGGGYVPLKDAEDITLIDMLKAVEEEIIPLECFVNTSICPLTDNCFTKDFWYTLKQQIEEALSGITLKSILVKHTESASQKKLQSLI